MRKESVTYQNGHLFGIRAERLCIFQPVSRPLSCVHIPDLVPVGLAQTYTAHNLQPPLSRHVQDLQCNSRTLKRYWLVTWWRHLQKNKTNWPWINKLYWSCVSRSILSICMYNFFFKHTHKVRHQSFTSQTRWSLEFIQASFKDLDFWWLQSHNKSFERHWGRTSQSGSNISGKLVEK